MYTDDAVRFKERFHVYFINLHKYQFEFEQTKKKFVFFVFLFREVALSKTHRRENLFKTKIELCVKIE